jgi:hypothetical protein
MLSKVSILLLFLRSWPQKPKRTIYATIAVVVLYSLIGSFHWLFACRPLEKFWDISITHGSCIEWSRINIFSGVMNTVTDIIILLLPICMLRRVRLPKWEKFGLGFVLMTGGLYVPYSSKSGGTIADVRNSVLVISIIRLKTTVDISRSPDITWEYVHSGIWWLVY